MLAETCQAIPKRILNLRAVCILQVEARAKARVEGEEKQDQKQTEGEKRSNWGRRC
jgi:hypothetical protein